MKHRFVAKKQTLTDESLISPPFSFFEMLSIDRNLLSLSASRASCPGDKFRPDHCNHSGNQDHAAEHADEHPHGQQEPHFSLKAQAGKKIPKDNPGNHRYGREKDRLARRPDRPFRSCK